MKAIGVRLTSDRQPTALGSQPDLLLPLVRQAAWVAFLLAIANGIFLYFLPDRAETGYAWAIKPPISAALMGAGYLSGVLATGLTLFVARYWRSVWGLIWPFFAIATTELLATIIHADRFRWDYWLTWIWAAVYIGIPPAVVFVWMAQQRVSHVRPLPDPRLLAARIVSGVLGAIVAAFALLLFFTPETFISGWPWQLTPLLARAFSAWYLQMGVALLFAALNLRRPHEAFIPYTWLVTINVLILLLPVIFSPSIKAGATLFWPWLLMHLALLVVAAWVSVMSFTLMRVEGERI